jgi:hypothetical protein
MERNPFEAPQTESKRPSSRSARHMRWTMVLFAVLLLTLVVSLLVLG